MIADRNEKNVFIKLNCAIGAEGVDRVTGVDSGH